MSIDRYRLWRAVQDSPGGISIGRLARMFCVPVAGVLAIAGEMTLRGRFLCEPHTDASRVVLKPSRRVLNALGTTLIFCSFLFCQPGHAAIASCYGREHNQVRTATGAHYDPWQLTAAHRSLPFGTRLRVCNLSRRGRGRRCVTVTINDRGPFVRGRALDLSLGACHVIGSGGLAHVSLRILGAARTCGGYPAADGRIAIVDLPDGYFDRDPNKHGDGP